MVSFFFCGTGNEHIFSLQMQFPQLSTPLRPDRIVMFCDHNLKPEHVETACVAIENAHPRVALELFELSAGEALKCIEGISLIWKTLVSVDASRSTLVVALGGGSVTDAVGFAASTFKRGLPWVAAPTTLLGLVDAAWGGKTGINWGDLKNIVGTFHLPAGVWTDPVWLETLPELEVWNGWMEMVKHALVFDPRVWADLVQIHPDQIPKPDLFKMAMASAAIKNSIVTSDPLENGQRKWLNFGHTIGHAIEAMGQEGPSSQLIPHGISVGWGMRFSIQWSLSLHNHEDPAMVEADSALSQWLSRAGFGDKPSFRTDLLWDKIIHDKKNRAGQVLEVRLEKIGKAEWDVNLDRRDFVRIWDRLH